VRRRAGRKWNDGSVGSAEGFDFAIETVAQGADGGIVGDEFAAGDFLLQSFARAFGLIDGQVAAGFEPGLVLPKTLVALGFDFGQVVAASRFGVGELVLAIGFGLGRGAAVGFGLLLARVLFGGGLLPGAEIAIGGRFVKTCLAVLLALGQARIKLLVIERELGVGPVGFELSLDRTIEVRSPGRPGVSVAGGVAERDGVVVDELDGHV
jgi:hypothetical protein